MFTQHGWECKEIFFALFISSCVYNVKHRVTLAEYTHDNH